jgi:hypothetical protein
VRSATQLALVFQFRVAYVPALAPRFVSRTRLAVISKPIASIIGMRQVSILNSHAHLESPSLLTFES